MYFVFSKLLLFLLFPLNWIIVLLLVSLISKKPKRKRRYFLTGMILLIVFTNPGLLYLFARSWDIDHVPLDKGRLYSAAIVLGGFSGDDKNGNGVFNEQADRFIQGVKLKEENKVSHILVSSGNGNLEADDFKEAAWVQKVLKEFNIPDSAVLIEQNSRNTFENATFSKVPLQKAHLLPPYLLVTSSWHMRRAYYIFKKAGVDVIPYPSGRITQNSKFSFADSLMPDAGSLVLWNVYLKELVGTVVAHIK
jgi:uncharacterized SAM-binding protein YcdF (DUF218 family)